jgi:hypothetical protein
MYMTSPWRSCGASFNVGEMHIFGIRSLGRSHNRILEHHVSDMYRVGSSRVGVESSSHFPVLLLDQLNARTHPRWVRLGVTRRWSATRNLFRVEERKQSEDHIGRARETSNNIVEAAIFQNMDWTGRFLKRP